MRRPLCFRLHALSFSCAVVLFLGCGGPKSVKVEGNLVSDGKPFIPSEGQIVSLSFASKGTEGQAKIFPAVVNSKDGSFTVNGGLTPGTYQVQFGVSTQSSDPDSLNKIEQMNNQFAPIKGKDCVIGPEEKKITIDVTKGTITK